MNTLSWFIYMAGVFGNLNLILGAFLFFGTLITVIITILGMVMHSDMGKEEAKFWEFKRQMCARWAARMWALIVVVSFVQIASPTRETMLAIAASQVGEQIAKTDTVKGIAGDAAKALELWIKKQIEAEKPKT